MKKKARILLLLPWAVLWCVLSAGCAGMEILNEIPRDYTLSGEASEVSAPGESHEESAAEEEIPEECFLSEEAFLYARGSLSSEEQIWYGDMERILGGFGEKCFLSDAGTEGGLDENNIDHIFQCVLTDHPELFYVEGYSYTKYTDGEGLSSVEFSGTYNMDVETAVIRREEIREAAEEILSGMAGDASDYDKVKYVYETVISRTDYDMEAPDNQNICSVFVHRRSVCQGYAKAVQYLLNRLGVECTLVLGTVETGEGHAWNLVKIDGNWYYVDATWGDVSYQMEDPSDAEAGIVIPEINYDYLNVTTEELLRTHSIGGEVPVPVCTAVEANYYVREGAFFTFCDREQLAELFRRAGESGRADVTVKCADRACYDEILDILVNRQEVFNYLTGDEDTIAYAQNEKQLSLTFWVTSE